VNRVRGAVLLALAAAPPLAGQPSGEAWLTLARGYHTSPAGGAGVAGVTAGFGVGSPTLSFGPEIVLRTADSIRVRGFGIGGRIRQRSQYLQPHLVASVGIYAWQRARAGQGRRWDEVEYLTASLGAGASIGTWRGRLSGLVEARWHRNVASSATDGSRSLVGVDAGLRVAW